jgi:hypothetical protein
MSFFKGQLLNHFKQLKPALERVGAEAFLNVSDFTLEVRFRGGAYVFRPQFVRFDARSGPRLVSEFRPDVFRFAGWCPYFGKRWSLAIEKLKFKEYAVKNRLLTPSYWLDPDVDVPDVVVKRNSSARGAGTRGPYRSSKESKLDVRDGEYYEHFVRGRTVKVWFWEGCPVCCELAGYGAVCGDGKRTIRELVLQGSGKRGKKVDVGALREFLAYEGKSLDSRPAMDEIQPVDFKYGSRLSFRSEVSDIDLRRDPIPGAEAQLTKIGSCLFQGIPERLRANTVFTVDAVLDAEQRLWVLAMDSDSFLHPYVYAPMIETWAKDPESSLRQAYELPDEDPARGGVALH